MSNYSLACSRCDELVIKSMSGELKIRSKIILIRDGDIRAVCKGCGTEIPVPLKLDEDTAKSLATKKSEPRLYLKR